MWSPTTTIGKRRLAVLIVRTNSSAAGSRSMLL
jgi:hypothetical protein